MRRLFLSLLLVLAALPVRAAHTQVRLVLSHESAKLGETVTAGIHLKMDAGWHTYWRNGGDSGAPTTIDWTLPKGVTAGEIQWPLPEKISVEGETTFIYQDEVVLMVPLTITADALPGIAEFKAKVAWLECEKLCVRGEAEVAAPLTVGDAKSSANAKLLADWMAKVPQPKPAPDARASWLGAAKGDSRPLLIEWTADKLTKEADFFPHASDKFVVKAATEQLKVAEGAVRLRKSVEKIESWPEQITGVLVERAEGGTLSGAREVTLSVKTASGSKPARAERADAPVEEEKTLLAWIGIAVLGGLILNLMPCVLPVIALKIFSFVAQSNESPQRVRKLGLLYGLGVLCSFLVMAAVVIGLQGAGKQASWGMQFGSAYFIVAMTALVTLVALNFFGVFEVTLGSGTMGRASELASREGGAGAFFNGVLTTVLATPCTAPFLAGAVGFAFAQPARIILIIFVAVAVGLAAPYVVLCFQPRWVRFLPKPGAWMEKFKMAMGFPMLATALWLLSLLDAHFGDEGILWVGVFLVCVAVAAWVWGEFVQRGSTRRGLALAMVVVFLAGGYVFALEMQLDWRHRETPAGSSSAAKKPGGIDWQPWSREAVETARGERRPVLVDFTARWCPNCRVNKRTSIEIPSVKQKLKEINAVALVGDNTLFPPAIDQELKRFKRAGVPLVLVYPADASKPPIVLPELLTPSIVLEALDAAAK